MLQRIFMIAYPILMFILQKLCFRKENKLRYLPPIVIAAVYLICLVLPVVDYAMMSAGRNDGVLFYRLVSLLLAGDNTVALLGVGIAWLIEKV